MKIAPSILAADLADLATAVKHCENGGARLIHVDVMDGHFVPNSPSGRRSSPTWRNEPGWASTSI